MVQSTSPTGLILKAAMFAAVKHSGQPRKDAKGSPYINHPIELANLLANEGNVTDANVICAAFLHDTIEDTPTTKEELIAAFGEKITSIVLEVTDDKELDKAVRKNLQIEHAPHKSAEAKLVTLADKICNLRDLIVSPPIGWETERIQEYFDWSGKVIAGLRGTHPVMESIFDSVHMRRMEVN